MLDDLGFTTASISPFGLFGNAIFKSPYILKILFRITRFPSSDSFRRGRKICLKKQTLIVETGAFLTNISIGSTLSSGTDGEFETFHDCHYGT